MTKVYASVDGPSVRVAGMALTEGIEIHGSPTYGRVLFRSHGVEIVGNTFDIGNDESAIDVVYAYDVLIADNNIWFRDNQFDGDADTVFAVTYP